MWIPKYLISLLAFSSWVQPASSQGVYEAWVVRYNGTDNSIDVAKALAVDDSGNIFVTGSSVGSGTSSDFCTIKYKANGDTLWLRRYNGPANDYDQANGIAVDKSGNVYVTGSSTCNGTSADYTTIKYTPNGDTAWVKRYNGPGNSFDQTTAIVLDSLGNVCVSGFSWGTGYDFASIMYGPNGDTLWVRRYDGPGSGFDIVNAMTADKNRNIYVVGYSEGSGTFDDYLTIKYSSNGDVLWVRRYDGPASDYDQANAVAVDKNNNIYVVGSSVGSGTVDDYVTIKYRSDGGTQWVRSYNGPSNSYDDASALAIDDSGNIFVTGSSVGSGTSSDFCTIKYKANGGTLWLRRYNGPANDYDQANGIAVDTSGNVYVTGSSTGNGTSADYTTIKYTPNGDTAWVKRYNGPGDANDWSYDLAIEKVGNVCITGWSFGNESSYDFATIKYVPVCSAKPGDANASGTHTLADVIAIVNYIFNKPGCTPTPPCWLSELLCRGDWDGSTTVTLSDVIRGVNYIFNKPGGPWNALPSGTCCM